MIGANYIPDEKVAIKWTFLIKTGIRPFYCISCLFSRKDALALSDIIGMTLTI